MVKGLEISTNEQTFLLEALQKGIRMDGRKVDEFRNVEISIGDEYGYIEIRMGKTKILARVSAEITQPFEDRPFEGVFQISTEVSPMASPMFEHNRQSSNEVLISRLIEKAIRRSGALDLESLCIVAGSKCWLIRADLHFLDYDGGFIDASCIAVMVGLSHFRKPDISINGDDIVVHSIEEREPVPLSILHMPICVTFSFFNPHDSEANIKGDANEELSIIDATLSEELLRQGELTLTLNKNREVCQISKAGGLPMDALLIMDLAKKAYTITERLTDQIKAVLKEDELKRSEKNKLLSASNAR
ncbi:hypothetical protein BABINDRAFT_162726 [Babjeviella inositovora NRRL Y-12698]|uniref:Exosome complex component RRP45 n=1 Tax=Babjeviella inositovora NRRL Y-12698 TaxID=984486 RepID=A0A1E3QLF7_9ASCO|nr:uncharacterized protein BABINDRAFT_162726 [Babjeviella inositovora NRRL Y-12698]ODQ78521.1 hypothetical protein BABINDRAFT_162726 [Babjeviella inositovora NRRL Y-12698]